MSRPSRIDRAAFEDVALPFMQSLYGTAWRLTRRVEDASDLVQETYLRAYRTFDSFVRGTHCKAWLFTILYSVHSNQARQRRRKPTTSMEELEARHHRTIATATPQEHRCLLEEGALRWVDGEVERALSELPEAFRVAVLLVDVEQLTYEEAAQALGCPVGTVRSRLSRARRALHGSLLEYARLNGYARQEEG